MNLAKRNLYGNLNFRLAPDVQCGCKIALRTRPNWIFNNFRKPTVREVQPVAAVFEQNVARSSTPFQAAPPFWVAAVIVKPARSTLPAVRVPVVTVKAAPSISKSETTPVSLGSNVEPATILL